MDSDKFQQFQRIEPRLAEYYLRKKFNKKNNIDDDNQILEKTYQVTNFDIKTINDFIKTGTIASKNLESQLYCEFIEIPKEKQKFASEELMNDLKYELNLWTPKTGLPPQIFSLDTSSIDILLLNCEASVYMRLVLPVPGTP